MEYPKTLEGLLVVCLVAVAIILCIFLIVAVARLNRTIKKANKTIDDVNVITGIAKERTTQVDKLISDAIKAANDFTESMKKGEGVFAIFKKASELVNKIKALFGIKTKDEALEESTEREE